MADVHLVRRLPQGEFPQCAESRFLEEILHGPLRLFRAVNHAALEPVEQGAGRKIDEHNFARLLHHPIGNRLPHLDSRDLEHLVVETLQMLNVHCGEHVDSGVEEHGDVLPTLGPLRARHIGVRELIDGADFRLPAQDGIRIHFLENAPAVFHAFAWDQFQTFELCNGFRPPMRLEVSDGDIVPVPLELLGFFQHLVCFTDASGVAEDDFEPPLTA